MPTAKVEWEAGGEVFAVAYDTPMVGWRGKRRQHAAAVARARRPDQARRLQSAGDLSAHLPGGPRRSDLEGALPQRNARPDRNCGCARSSSSPRPRCRTCAPAHRQFGKLDNLPDKVAIQLNDTHPASPSPS
jgi:starch phosphorylase